MWRVVVYRKYLVAAAIGAVLLLAFYALGHLSLAKGAVTRTITVAGQPVVITACQTMTLFGVKETIMSYNHEAARYRCE